MMYIRSGQVTISQKLILKDLNLDFIGRQKILLSAPNGSGKTSFLKALLGLSEFDLSGQFSFKNEFENIDVLSLQTHERSKLGLWLVAQDLPAIPGLTIIQFLKELVQLYQLSLSTKDLLLKVKDYQQRLGLESDFYKHEVHNGLSGGQQKRLEMLQLLLIRPKYILLDEIDSGLDLEGKKVFSKLLNNELSESFQLMVTHNQDFYNLFEFDKILTIKNQQLVEV